jgi:tetratricopeptide (TPR) repeat protein
MPHAGEMPTADTNGKVYWWHFALIFAVAIIPYVQSLGFQFAWDDTLVIVDNPSLQSWKLLSELILHEDKIGNSTGYYRPLTYLTFLIDRTVWGLNPFGYHLTNILLHASVAITLYAVLNSITNSYWLPLASGILFASHPLNAEAVSFLAGGRNTLLAALFCSLSMFCYIRGYRFFPLLFFALSICSKESGILLPVLFFLYDRWFTEKRGKFFAYIPYALVACVYLALRFYVVGGSGVNLRLNEIGTRLSLVPHLLSSYIRNLVWPFNLKIPYDMEDVSPISWEILFAAALLGVVAVILLREKDRLPLFFLVWFLLFLLPALNIIPLGAIAMADRYAYLPALGGVTILACLADKILYGWWRYLLLALCSILFGVLAFRGSSSWSDSQRLFMRMMHDAPQMSIGYYNMGYQRYEAGDNSEALSYLEKALAARHKTETEEILFYLGMVNWELGDRSRAGRVFGSLASMQNLDTKKVVLMARFFEESGDLSKRNLLLEKFGIRTGDYKQMLHEIAMHQSMAGEQRISSIEPEKAWSFYYRAFLYDSRSIPALIGMGDANRLKGREREAIRFYMEAAAVDPSNPLPFEKLAVAYERIGQSDAAADAKTRYMRLLGEQKPQ